jgi:DNA-binding beta-propeller fold protein YncE
VRSILLVLVLFVAAGAQYVEDVIYLPDSLSGLRYVDFLLHNPANNNVFAAGRGGAYVIVFDGVTNRRFARLEVGPVAAMCYNPNDNAVYCATASGSVFVLDGASGSILSSIPGAGGLNVLCHNPIENKLYGICSWEEDRDDSTVTVIDCDAGQVSGRIAVGRETEELCFNPDENRLYCTVSDSEGVAVIDCVTDSVMKYVYTGVGMYELLYNPLSRRLYVAEGDDGDLVFLHTGPDTVIGWVALGSWPDKMVLNKARNEVYVLDEREIDFVCGWGDSLLGWIGTGAWLLNVVLDSVGDALFLSGQGKPLLVLDCAVDSLTDTVWLSSSPHCIEYNPVQRRVYAGGEVVSVVDAESRQVEDFFRLWFGPTFIEYASGANKVYCAADVGLDMVSIDAAQNRVAGFIPVAARVGLLGYADAVDRLYVSLAHDSAVTVVDCQADTVLGEFWLAGEPRQMLYNPSNRKFYCTISAPNAVQVVVCGPDTASGLIPGIEGVQELILDPDGDRVFGLHWGGTLDTLFAIDCTEDTVVGMALTDDFARALCYMPRHHQVALAGGFSPAVVIAFYDAQTLELLGGADVDFGPGFLVYSSVSDRLYSVSSERQVEVIDPVARQVVRRVDTGLHPLRVDFDTLANRIYLFCSDGVGVFDCEVDTVTAWLPIGYTDHSSWASPYRRMYVADRDDSRVWVIRDSTTVGIVGEPKVRRERATQTVVRGTLPYRGAEEAALVDITGRKVMDLKPGENDVRSVAPGVYFITPHPNLLPQGERERRSRASGKQSAVRKVIVNP